jgi:hypothetical protein
MVMAMVGPQRLIRCEPLTLKQQCAGCATVDVGDTSVLGTKRVPDQGEVDNRSQPGGRQNQG